MCIRDRVRKHIANAYRLVFHGQTSLFDAINQIKDQVPDGPEIQMCIRDRNSAIVIPQEACSQVQDKIFVYIVTKDNKVKYCLLYTSRCV